ncbi:HAD-like domain-containing protein [Syncephalis pseudoplumigaleata]|uniref:phosphoserine phosphatase n=1 Tax=Syncephalis pseudoplumigaleata TaxID=1712513 RepID=A0A4P9Z157_9FUNG|nr:HAD-like domain-containing protein [Syncephalis pseudoplumigaleata]|eukprot:RKP26207.1 HAD-like domain-containing protein [Syncephalis pseudoplumigaleata]
MKFAAYLEERKALLPDDSWRAACINYADLKRTIKHSLQPCSIHVNALLPGEKAGQARKEKEGEGEGEGKSESFGAQLATRLASLQQTVPQFFFQLDTEVAHASEHVCYQVAKTAEAFAKSELTASDALRFIVQVESFAFLNYTAIAKVLKKHDRHTGLGLGEAYLLRIAETPLVRFQPLSAWKQRLLQGINASATEPRDDAKEAVVASTIDPTVHAVQAAEEAVAAAAATSSIVHATATSSDPAVQRMRDDERKNWFPPASHLPHQRILVTMSGPHGTDIIGCVLDCAARYAADVEDFMLSRLYHQVTFAALLRLTDERVELFRDLAEAARKWDAQLLFEPHNTDHSAITQSIEEAPYAGRVKYAATVLNRHGLTAAFLDDWTKLLLAERISVEKMTRLNAGRVCCADYQLSVPDDVDLVALREKLFQLSMQHATDVALQQHNVFRRNKRLVVFDMDSTLIQQEVIDEIARHAGVMDQVAAITAAAMNGEIDFNESLRRRVALLEGTPTSVLAQVRDRLTFTEGAHFLCRALKRLGFKLAVISGGFMPLATYVKNELGLDYAFANQLKTTPDGRTLTGETIGPIVNGERKAELLEVIAQAESVSLDQVVAVGDGANDLWMLAKAGLGIAFDAKPRVQEQARARINQKSLKYVLYLLGYTDADARQLYDDI